MSSYFTVPLFARAKKNQDELRKSNPQVPVLKDDDEKFLERQISSEDAKDRIIFSPEKTDTASGEASSGQRPSSGGKRPPKNEGIELPSQEEAEAITHNYHQQASTKEQGNADDSRPVSGDEKRTWVSYIPSIPTLTKKDPSSNETSKTDSSPKTPSTDDQRTWAQYASTYIPSPLKPKRTDADAAPTPIYRADGSVDEAATKAQQENEMAVLLAQLNTGTLNNRVFALNLETQKLYQRFALALRDTINGVPTAYEDMDALMREAGPTLEAQFKALPPFLQSLVRSLPAKLSAVLAPELLASIGGKPDAELEAAADAKMAGEKGETAKGAPKKAKKKRRIPGLKSLMSKEGALAGMLRGAVEFVKVRFPFLASTTNVVLSLAVFILMFVCWYCHKRGKEVRLEKAAGAERADALNEGEASSMQAQYSDSDEDASDDEDPELEEKIENEIDQNIKAQESSPTDMEKSDPVAAGSSSVSK